VITKGIKKNRVQFLFGADRDTITLICWPKFFEVVLTRERCASTAIHLVCTEVRDLVESTLNTVTSCMNISFLSSYKVAFECPSHPGKDHLCVVDSNEESPHMMDCLHDNHNPQKLQPTHLVWFGKVKGSSAMIDS